MAEQVYLTPLVVLAFSSLCVLSQDALKTLPKQLYVPEQQIPMLPNPGQQVNIYPVGQQPFYPSEQQPSFYPPEQQSPYFPHPSQPQIPVSPSNIGQGIVPVSPCPQLFRYTRNEYGQIEGLITSPYEAGASMTLTVNASMKGYFGKDKSNMKLTLLTPATDLFFQKVPFVKYLLKFPVQDSIPKITQITMNGRLLCSGPPETLTIPGPPISEMQSSHRVSFSAARKGFLDSTKDDDYFYPEDWVD